MEEDIQDGPFTVWQMFNAPTMVLFNNLEHAADGLERLLTSITKLSGDSSEVLVPRPGSSKYPDTYYREFNTWLLGRLFYVWSVKELSQIHDTSKEAQLKILNILCANGASFYETIHSEYWEITSKLITFYEENHRDNQCKCVILNNFKSEQINCPNVQLDLKPIYVQVKDIETCKNMLDLILQLLTESLPTNSIQRNKNNYDRLFNQVLHVLEHYSLDLKLVVLRFFIRLIKNYNQMCIDKFCKLFPEIFKKFLQYVESMTKAMKVYHEIGEANDLHIDAFDKLIKTFLCEQEITNEQEEITNICSVILQNKTMYSKDLKQLVLSLGHKLDFKNDLIDMQHFDSNEINSLIKCYSQNILRTEINNLADMQNCSGYYGQIIKIIKLMKDCEDRTANSVVITYHLKRCHAALNILVNVYLQYKQIHNKEITLLSSDNIFCLRTSLIKLIESHKNLLLENRSCLDCVMQITLMTLILSKWNSKDDANMILQILCLQSKQAFSEQSFSYNDAIKMQIAKYLILVKLIMKSNINETWNRVTSFLINTIVKTKSKEKYKEIIALCPLILANKSHSASKLIGELLMPALLTKDADTQKQLVAVLQTMSCMSFGTYSLIIHSPKNVGHLVFTNHDSFSVSIVCSTCHHPQREQLKIEEFISQIIKENKEIYSESYVITPSKLSATKGLKNLFSQFLNWRHYTDLEANGFWILLESLCKHYYVFDHSVPNDIIKIENTEYLVKALKPFLDISPTDDNDSESILRRQKAFDHCIKLLVESTKTSLENNDYALQTNTLNIIKEFGLCNNEKVILPSTKLMVYFIMHPQCPVGPKAVIFLRDICEKHNFTPNQVYHRYKKDYCRLFVECSLYNGKEFAIALLKVVRAFGFIGYRDFISKDVHHFLPYLIPYSVTIKEVPSMIEEIASLVQCSVSDFLVERFPHIYVHVYLNESSDVSLKCYQLIERLTNLSILSLIKRHFRVILTEFLLQYCCNPEKVLNACRHLASHDPDVSSPISSKSMSMSRIADFLNPKFLGVLAYFDHKLVNAKVALSVKRKALASFPDILQLMGVRYLTPLRFKVLATLRSALPLAKEFPKLLAEAWNSFIHNIDSISLGPLLANLAVSLMQQFEYAPDEINNIFQYLVLNSQNLLGSHISDLFFLEDTNVSVTVKMVIKRYVKRSQPDGFLEKIKWYLNHLNQDIPSIKAYAFSDLDKLMKSNRTEIHKAIFGGKNIDPIIVELMDALLVGCKDPNSEVSTASGACLGQLGAIEAGHLPRRYVQPDSSPFAFYISDDCFAATALVELSRAFQYEKDTMNMDCYALTIQEILKIYDISPTGSKKDVWDSFPEHMHQVMFPLLSSRYTLAYPSQPKKAHPLFGSSYATTFVEWAHNWAGQLISLIESENIRDLLRTVHPSMRRDVRTLFLFLPYVLLHAVVSKTNLQYIQEEMLAVIGLENLRTESVSTEKVRYKMLRHIRMIPSINSVLTEEGNQDKCSKTIYTLLDFLNRWILEWCHTKQKPLENENYIAITSFVDKFDKLTIARGNFACGELERALQYLELYMSDKKDRMQEQLPFLAEIYALLDEPDAVAGILSMKRCEPSLKELILAQVVTGRLQDAALCYERLAQEGPLDKPSLQGMIDCYLGLDQPFTAYRLLNEHSDDSMLELTAEPLWRLGRWQQLDELVKKPVPQSKESWGLLMGRILLSYRSQNHDIFLSSCKDATVRLLSQMDAESHGESALRSGYQSVMGLHIVSEARHAEEMLIRLKSLNDRDRQSAEVINQLLDEWRRRLSLVQSDVRTIEPLLTLRRILLQQTQELLQPTHPSTANKLRSCIGDLWLQSAKQARKAGIFQQSYMYILNAEEYRPEELFIEKSKMYWARAQHEQAFTTLRRGLDDAYPTLEQLTTDERKICAQAKLLIAKYNDETTNVDVDVNIGYYKESVEVFKQWEKSLVCLGAYYEKVSSSDSTSASTMWSRRLHALNSYGKALQCGHKYLYQTMPRMLSIWLDVEVTSHDTSVHSVLAQMTEIIKTFSERLPLYLYLTAFSQIVSRICHPVKEVYLQLKAIIVKLIIAYPQHTLWMMMSVIKSSYPQRIKRCNDVLADQRLKEPRMLKLLNDFTQLAEKLIELCNKPIALQLPGLSTTVSALVRTLPRLLATENFSRIMMPFQEFCKIVLPSKAARQEKIDLHIPTEPEVYIAGIEENIQILPSLQKPRKVTLKGSNGKSYIIMLKPRDDLRKDYRLMEFNGVVNRILQDAPETRRRRLYIRTYSVLPLNEECGLIEWVPNLVGLRPILMHIYKQKNIHTSNRELKEMMCSNKDPIEKKRRIYEEQLVTRHPAVFQEWFRRSFSDPYGWYQARSAYIRTTAVMSMVGYILGLGDRHGENISFDLTNGDTVHVDFNCLFNKGETFEWPERVPFRLTHNMEAAMGPLKHEGLFRKCCEAVMVTLRAQTAALMSVVGPFVYDPLVSWGRARVDAAERTNDHALQHLQHIRQRLNGMVRTKNKQLSLSLSPEGQVEHLIVEATSVHNLCQMYIGWGPFL